MRRPGEPGWAAGQAVFARSRSGRGEGSARAGAGVSAPAGRDGTTAGRATSCARSAPIVALAAKPISAASGNAIIA